MRSLLAELAIALKRHRDVIGLKIPVRSEHNEHFARRCPRAAGRLGQEQQHVLALVQQSALDQIDRENAQAGECNHSFFEILRVGGAVNAGLGDGPDIKTALGFANGDGMRVGTLTDLTLHRGRDVVDGVANGGNHLRIGGLEPGANFRRGRFQQLEKILPREIAALAKGQGQLAVVAGATGELAVARE